MGGISLQAAAIGGLLIGCAAVWLYASLGRVAGISGIVGQLLGNRGLWPLWFLLGLAGGGWLGALLLPPDVSPGELLGPGWMLLAGLLVGFGTRLGSGCTSGHGVCGIARLSMRSIVATLVFMVAGMATATWLHGP